MSIKEQIGESPFVVLPGVDLPIKIIHLGPHSKLDLRYFTQDPANGVVDIDNSSVINQVKLVLGNAKLNNYVDLASGQPLVRDGQAGVTSISRVLTQYGSRLHGVLVAELLDLTPRRRFPDFQFSDRDHNAVIYRGSWKVLSGYPKHGDTRKNTTPFIDVSEMDLEEDVIPVSLRYTKASHHEWLSLTGVLGYKELYRQSLKQRHTRRSAGDLLFLGWDRQRLILRGAPNNHYTNHCAILGSRLSMDGLLEHYVQTYEDRQERAGPYIKNHGFKPTEHLLSILAAQSETHWDQEMEIWQKALADTRNGDFDPRDQLQVELEYTRYYQLTGRNYQSFDGLVSETSKHTETGVLPESRIGIDLNERKEAALTAYEALVLLDYLGLVSKAALESGRRLVILENRSNGVYSVEPIKDFLDPIEIIQCYFSSGGNEGFVPKRLEELIAQEKPWLAMVDGTNNVSSLGQNPRSFGHFRGFLSQRAPDYQIMHWNPNRFTADYLRTGKSTPVFEPPVPAAEPQGILIVSSIPDNNIPDWLKKELALGVEPVPQHRAAPFDDWPKKDLKKSYFNRFGIQSVSALEMLLDSISTAVRGYRQDSRILSEIISRRIIS